jgi:hypothetical protein
MWAEGRVPKGPLEPEQVRFLLIHHTAEPGNGYGMDEVPGLLRGIYDFHTGSSKGWPDLAYNFFVDAFGRIWEGRTGSLKGPVRGSATGGNQGWTQLCCFLGDFQSELPTEAARLAMVSLVAWLADRYDVDVTPGATVSVESLGSNRWPAGSTIDARTISAHREMSMTDCPGDACFEWVRNDLPAAASAVVGAGTATAAPSATEPADGSTTTQPSTSAAPEETTTTTTTPATSEPPPSVPSQSTERARASELAGSDTAVTAQIDAPAGAPAAGLVAGGVVAATGLAAGLGVLRAHRRSDDPHSMRYRNDSWEVTVSGVGPNLHVGLWGDLAWVLDGGWDEATVDAALAEMKATTGAQEGLRPLAEVLVAALRTSQVSKGVVVLAEHRPDLSTGAVLGVGATRVRLFAPDGPVDLTLPVETAIPASVRSLSVRSSEPRRWRVVLHRRTPDGPPPGTEVPREGTIQGGGEG